MYTGPDIQDGMTVYDSAENKIGTIVNVYPNLGSYGMEQTSGQTAGQVAQDILMAGTSAAVPVGAEAGTTTGEGTPYFEVDQGGILGIGAKHLYIPFTAIQAANMNDKCLTVNCTKQQADDLYEQKPAFLQNR